MKIAIFSDTFPPQVNGVSSVVAQSAMRLALRGHDVRVMTSSQGSKKYIDGITQGKYIVHNIMSVPSGVYPDIRLSVPVATTLLKLKGWVPDIVHTHTIFGVGLAAVRCAKRFDVPLIGTHHTFFDEYLKHIHMDTKMTRSMSWKLTVKFYNHCDLVLAPSHSLIDELIAHGLQTPSQVLPNPIDTELFKLTPNQLPNLGGSGADLIYMGRLSYEKSLDQVIRAFDLIVDEIPEATLTIIGNGPERKKLETMVRKLDLSENVRFTGVLRGQNLANALRQGDLFMTASKTENIPLSVLEAMASGLPVAAVNMKGLPEIVKDGVTGVLVKPDCPEDMAFRIVELLGDRELLLAYSLAAQEFAMGFSQDRVMQESEFIYQDALGGI